MNKMPERILFAGGDLEERQASKFALEILMPEETFREKVRSTSGDVVEIAKAFGVSPLAVRFRAAYLGMKGHKVSVQTQE